MKKFGPLPPVGSGTDLCHFDSIGNSGSLKFNIFCLFIPMVVWVLKRGWHNLTSLIVLKQPNSYSVIIRMKIIVKNDILLLTFTPNCS